MSSRSATAVPRKRKNFTETDDILLLKQVLADEPFRHSEGKVMDKWNKLADVLLSCPDFSRESLAGKTAQNRVTLLIDAVGERALNKAADAKKEAVAEAAGEMVRKLAVERLMRPASDVVESPAKGTKRAKIVGMLAEYKDKELAGKREQWEAERADRLELECERLAVERQRQLDNQRLIEVLALLAKR